jgi:hypothetical protein
MSLKQSSNESPTARSSASGGDRACWHRDRNCSCLKIDAAPSESFLFPYQQFSHAQHTRTADGETLNISFGEHEVIVTGTHLDEIAVALQELAVERISVTLQTYGLLTHGDEPHVARIEIKQHE